MKKTIRVLAPATIANIGSGFDLIGMAITGAADVLTIQTKTGGGVSIVNATDTFLPTDPLTNTASVAVLSLLQKLKTKTGIEITVTQKIRPGGGLGSSAASAVAAVVGANELLGNPFSREELLPFALEGEKAASGVYHADNVAPALFGGVCFVSNQRSFSIEQLPFPKRWTFTLLTPNVVVNTSEARKKLPKTVSLLTAVNQAGNFGNLLLGFMKKDQNLLAAGLNDLLATPARKNLIPEYDALKQVLKPVQPIGYGISGSGPTIFVISENKIIAEEAAICLQHHFSKKKIAFSIFNGQIREQGATLI